MTHMPGDTANGARGDALHHMGFQKERFLQIVSQSEIKMKFEDAKGFPFSSGM